MRKLMLILLVALGLTLTASPASAAKLTGQVSVAPVAGDTELNWGDTIVVTATVSDPTVSYFVNLNCYVDGVHVYSTGSRNYMLYGSVQTHTLAGGMWTSGAAECTATLEIYQYKSGRFRDIREIAFSVAD